MQRTPLLGVAASLCLVFAVAACGGEESGDSKADFVDQVSETLQASSGLDQEAADCKAGVLVDDLGVDTLKDIDLSADQPPEDLQEELVTATAHATDECNLSDASG
jgi:hypothetical protein